MPFPCQTFKICSILHISRQTLVTARNHLAELGLISFTEGKSRSYPSSYTILEWTDNLTRDLTLNNNYNNYNNNINNYTQLSWEETKSTLNNDVKWLEGTAKYLAKKDKSMSLDEVKGLLDRFFRYLELTNNTKQSIVNLRKYFLNWAAKEQKDSASNTPKKVSNNTEHTDFSKYKYNEMQKRISS